MKPQITVITSTYNPRPDHLSRIVVALQEQTLPATEWEYLLVDNNSTPSVTVDLDWHPQARLLYEPRLGKIHALLRAVKEAQGELLVIVDDDNVLSPNYLKVALEIASAKPFLGVWGGQILPEFEVPAPDWVSPYLHYLTLKSFSREEWSNLHTGPAPAGAGMCLRSSVASCFVENLASHPERLQLGRTGCSVLTGEDWEMSLAACDLGLGMGHMPQLSLTHLIAASRLETDYMMHLVETMSFSRQVFVHMRGLHSELQYPPTRLQRLERWLKSLGIDSVRRKFLQAEWRALDQANKAISQSNLDDYTNVEATVAKQIGVRSLQ